MKRLIYIFILITSLSTTVFSQAPAVSQDSDTSHTGYGYRGRAEVFVTGFGLLTHQTTGNTIGTQATKAGGGAAGYRFRLNGSSALEGRYGFSRNSQKYTLGNAVTSVPAYLSEISGSYVYNFSTEHGLRPFLEGGAGVVLFSPANYGGGGNPPLSYSTDPLGYSSGAVSYSGSSSLPRQAKAMFVYGAGADVPAFRHLYLRVEFRALGYKQPDFGAAALHSNAFTFAYEPSAGVVYRF